MTIQTRKWSLLIIGAISLFLFFIVALITTNTQGMLLDENVGYWASGFEDTFLIKIMKLISIFGSTTVILILTVLLGLFFLIKRSWKNFFFFFTVSVGGVIINFVLKTFIRRERPGEEVSNIEVFNFTFDIPSYSFPSGHTMRATIFFLFIIYLAVRYLYSNAVKIAVVIACSVIILLVALSRIFLDAHFATDTIGAIFMGATWFFICSWIFVKSKQRGYTYYINR